MLLSDLKSVVDAQLLYHPKMQPQDLIHLVQQHLFGNVVTVSNASDSLAFLKKEYDSNVYEYQREDLSSLPFCEPIGNYYTRVNLLKLKAEELELFNRIYIASASLGTSFQTILGTTTNGTCVGLSLKECATKEEMECYLSRLYLLSQMAAAGMFSFSGEDMEEALKAHERAGYPIVHHSNAYMDHYMDTAYRVIDERFLPLIGLIRRLDELFTTKERVILGIDGAMGTGKTTIAYLLSSLYETSVIPTEDFPLPPDLAKEKDRLKEPGGNFHYEYLRDYVIQKIKKENLITYPCYDERYVTGYRDVCVPASKLMIVDGTYSEHFECRKNYDLKIFCKMDPAYQASIIQNKYQDYNAYQDYLHYLKPYEDKYFEHYEIEDRADLVYSFPYEEYDFKGVSLKKGR
ncbi:MAG: hypothetical protein K6C69_04570 [Lachnospiraceae bacterium]|nr:hypothetical protein [Lachnospiraceae bacterium]